MRFGRAWRRLRSRSRRGLVLLVVLALVLATAAGVAIASARSAPPVASQDLRVPVGPEPDGTRVSLDATLFLPPAADDPAPAVVLAHGFGGSKADLAGDAVELARDGYVVLTYSARGFGRSGGRIHLDSLDYEVRDAQRLVDLLATRPEVRRDGAGDPRVGFAGGSYGGALSLLVAGVDPRVDAIVPTITWNDLGGALFPQHAVTGPTQTPAGLRPVATPGVFKRLWAGLFFGAGTVGVPGAAPGAPASSGPPPGPSRPSSGDPTCGRFAPDVCAAYEQVAATGVPTARLLDLLRRSSPATVLEGVRAPTLLVQGEADSLFPLSQADANARGIAATGTPVSVVWYDGGHDASGVGDQRVRDLTLQWFDHYLRRAPGAAVDHRFQVTLPAARVSTADSQAVPQVRVAPAYPGIEGAAPAPTRSLHLAGRAQTVIAPAGGNPAALTSLPGLAAVGSALQSTGALARLAVLPGQSAVFQTAPLTSAVRVVGAPQVTLRVSSTTSDATLFGAVYDVAPGDGPTVLPQQLVAPVRLTGLTPTPRAGASGGTDVTVSLPAVVHEFAAGHRMRVVVSTTDQAYAMPQTARTYTIALSGGGALRIPVVATEPLDGGGVVPVWLVALVAGLLLVAGALAVGARLRRRRDARDPALADVPLVVSGLSKEYADGFRAVSDLSFRVAPGTVLGLLGPNGAGKTTTLRMLMGLIRPTAGELRVFGEKVTPGAPVLSRVGAFVEGPGFLPHLSGLDNLRLYWRATGRPEADARLDTALEIAGLGDDVHRRVKTYSQGMRARLAIAQAMLGLPDLLVLDEPTNGLDPPQIREMREVLTRYAGTGRTVLVSSHLLSEVEQTCGEVVVMHRGRLVAQGPVRELVGAGSSFAVDVDDPPLAARVASGVAGVREVVPTPTGVVVSFDGSVDGQGRPVLLRALVEAGLAVDRAAPQRRLEEVFLRLVGEAES